MPPVKIFITDDHYMIVEGIRSLLQNEKSIEWMGHAMNATSCIAFLKLQQPDVILMDINLPDLSGIDLCKQVSTTTVDTHRKNLLAKFAVKNTATLIRMAAQYQLI